MLTCVLVVVVVAGVATAGAFIGMTIDLSVPCQPDPDRFLSCLGEGLVGVFWGAVVGIITAVAGFWAWLRRFEYWSVRPDQGRPEGPTRRWLRRRWLTSRRSPWASTS